MRIARFAAAIAAVGFVWLVILPFIGRQEPVARHIETQQRLGIDPSAMYYTELEILPPIAHRMERLDLLSDSLRESAGTRRAP